MRSNSLPIIFIVITILTVNMALVQAHHENAPPGTHVMPDGTVMKNSDMMTGNVVASQESGGLGFVGWTIIVIIAIGIIWYMSKKVNFTFKN